MVQESGGAAERSDRRPAEGEGAGAERPQQRSEPDQIGPLTKEEVRAATLEAFSRTHNVRARLFSSSPTAYTDTIADLVEAIEALADAVGCEYPVDALRCPRIESSPEGEV